MAQPKEKINKNYPWRRHDIRRGIYFKVKSNFFNDKMVIVIF